MAAEKRVVLIDLTVETSKVVKSIETATTKVSQLQKQLKDLQEALNSAGVKGSSSFKEAEKAVAGQQKELEKTQQQIEKYKTQLAEVLAQSKATQAAAVQAARDEQKAREELSKAAAKEEQDKQKAAAAAEKKAAAQKAADEAALQQTKELEEAIQQVGDTIGATFQGGLVPQATLDAIAATRTELARVEETNRTLKAGLEGLEVGSEKYNQLQQALAGNEAQLRGLRIELTRYQKEVDNAQLKVAAEKGSYEELYRTYIEAERNLKNLGNTLKINKDGTVEITDEYKKAAKEVRQLKEGLLEFNKGILDGRLNVGNYTQSFADALSATGLFGDSITKIQGAITGTSTAIGLVKDGVKLLSDGFTAAGSAFSTFGDSITSFTTSADDASTTVTSTVDSFTNLSDSASETKETLETVGDAGTKSGKAILTGSNIGANGMKILKLAIASTGVGLLVIAVGSLIAYFGKFQKGIDLVKQAFAGATAVFEVVVGTLGKIGEAIASFSFDGISDAVSGFGDAAVNSAKKAVALEQSKQKLEDQERKSLKTQFELRDAMGDLMLIAEDKTKTDQERVDAIKAAAVAEQKLIADQLANEQERLRILDEELALKQEAGTATREELLAREELAVKVMELEDDYQDKLKEGAVAASKLQAKINEERLNTLRALNSNEIRLAELQGKSTYDLRRKMAKEELDAVKADGGKSADEKKIAESNYQVAIAEINAEAAAARKQKREENAAKERELDRALEDSRIALITDGKTRELAAEAVALNRRLEEIKGNSEKERQLREQLTLESGQRALDIEQKYAQERIEKVNEENQKTADALIAGVERTYDDKQQAIDNALADELITQEQAAAQSLAIELEKQQQILEIQKRALADRTQNEKTFYDEQEKLVQDKLSQGTINAAQAEEELKVIRQQRKDATLLTEQELGQAVIDTQRGIDQTKIDLARATSEEIKATAEDTLQRQLEAQNIAFDAMKTAFSGFAAALSVNEAARKKNAAALKTLAAGEVLIGMYQEISGYWTGAGKDAAKTGVIGATGATVLATLLTAAAIARGMANISKIKAEKYADGGFTLGQAVAEFSPRFSPKYSGGFVESPTMWVGGDGGLKLAGEAGTEWVGANWQVKQAPQVFAALESWRRTGVRPFADGGFTSMNVSGPIIDATSSVEAALMRGFSGMPSPVVSVVEINEVQNRVQTIESRSTLS